MIEHGAALVEEDRKALESAMIKANDIHMEDYDGDHTEIADKLHDVMQALRTSLISKVQDQSAI
jgi:hypothetical protein